MATINASIKVNWAIYATGSVLAKDAKISATENPTISLIPKKNKNVFSVMIYFGVATAWVRLFSPLFCLFSLFVVVVFAI